jgi:hypothetical protein
MQAVEIRVVVLGWWCWLLLVVGCWGECRGGEASNKGRFVQCRVEINIHFNLIFKLQSLHTFRMFFEICSRNFPAKVAASFVLTGQELS